MVKLTPSTIGRVMEMKKDGMRSAEIVWLLFKDTRLKVTSEAI